MPLYPAFERVYRPDVPTEGRFGGCLCVARTYWFRKTGDTVTDYRRLCRNAGKACVYIAADVRNPERRHLPDVRNGR